MTTFGEIVRERRLQVGLTLDELATRIGKTKGFLSTIETNKRSPSRELVDRLAAALDADAEEWRFIALERDRLQRTLEDYPEHAESFLRTVRRNRRPEE